MEEVAFLISLVHRGETVRLTKLATLASFALCAAAAHAQLSLGGFTFNNNQFGNTLLESDGGSFSAANYLNTVNSDPGNPGYLTGANFDTGIANIGIGGAVTYTIGYNTPIVNNGGNDFGVVVARFSADDFVMAVSVDGVNFGSDILVSAAGAVDSGVSNGYFYQGTGPQFAELWVHSLDLSAFGVASGESVKAIRFTSASQLDIIRVAGMNEAVPEPASMVALGIGAMALMRRRRKK